MPDCRPLIIRLKAAEWDVASREKLKFLLAAATERPRVYVDMSAVTYMDAACLGKLACMQRERVRKSGFRPAGFIVPCQQVRKLFSLVGFDLVWPIFGSLTEAFSDNSQYGSPHKAAM